PPEFTSQFAVLVLINAMIESISGPLMIGAQATGKIKWYQVTLGTLIFLSLPISYILLKYFNVPSLVFWVMIGINFISLMIRIRFLKHLMNLDVLKFIKEVLFKIIIVVIIVIMASLFLSSKLYF